MKIAKIIGFLLTAIVITVVAVGIYVWSSLDALVEEAIETHGSELTQTKVDVAGVKIELTSGKGSIQGLTVASPVGFGREQLFTLDNISIAVDPETVTKDVVIIDEIRIQSPQVFYEINDKGVSNADELKKNVQQSSSGKSKPAKPAKPASKPVKFIIRKFIIEKGEVDARIAALNDKDISANLPRIELKNLGKKQGGATPEQLAKMITDALQKQLKSAVVEMGANQYLAGAKKEAEKKLKEKISEELDDKLGDALKGLFSK